MSYKLPPIGTSGTFDFKAPFNSSIDTKQKLTVMSVTSMKEMVDSGIDVKTFVYVNAGLTATDYNDAFDKHIPIISFANDDGSYFYLPADYLSSMPKNDGVEYVGKSVVIKLGELPSNLDLSLLETELKDKVLNVLGVEVDLAIVESSAKVMKSYSEHENLESIRNTKPELFESVDSKYLKLKNTNDKLLVYVKALEEYSIKKYQEDAV